MFARHANGTAVGQTRAVEVSLNHNNSGPTALLTTHGPSLVCQYIGAVVGIYSTGDNPGPDSSNYAYLGGSSRTTPGFRPIMIGNSWTIKTRIQRSIESTMWKCDFVTGDIVAQEFTDSYAPATYIIYTQGILALAGDPSAVAKSFGSTNIVTFTCVLRGSQAPA